jgi:hypothetical protein
MRSTAGPDWIWTPSRSGWAEETASMLIEGEAPLGVCAHAVMLISAMRMNPNRWESMRIARIP